LLGSGGVAKASASDYTIAVLLLGAGGATAAVIWGLPKIQAREIRREHQVFLNERFSKLHCPNDRYLETSEDGFVFGCGCKRTNYGWSQLVSVVESGDVFIIRTKDAVEVVPKPAFPDEAAITEFRQLLASHMDRPSALKARAVEVMCTRSDLRWARWLHVRRGGGWRGILGRVALAVGFAVYLGYLAVQFDPSMRRDGLLLFECGALGLLLYMFLSRRRPPYRGPLRVWFSEEALHVEYPFSLIRLEWYRFIAYLEDSHNLLLYQDPQTYLALPQRFIESGQREYVGSMLRTKLRAL
jgi:YcxB-like protein